MKCTCESERRGSTCLCLYCLLSSGDRYVLDDAAAEADEAEASQQWDEYEKPYQP